jgi:hypothetical protein
MRRERVDACADENHTMHQCDKMFRLHYALRIARLIFL